ARILRDGGAQVLHGAGRIAAFEIVGAEAEAQQGVVLAGREKGLEALVRIHVVGRSGRGFHGIMARSRAALGQPRRTFHSGRFSMLRMLRFALAAFVAFIAGHGAGAAEREVAIGLQSPVTSMDPHYHNLSPNNSLLIHIFEPLVYRDADMKLKPALATSWKPLDDLTWEFKLRRNVRFHDGTPFTAEDVVATYKRVPNVPNSPSSYATFTKPIVETRIVDPYTIGFKTAAPHVLMPSDLAAVYIVPKAVAEKAATEDFNSGKAAIGTGPYKLVEFIPNQRIVLKANYGYWGGEEPWETVTFKMLSNPAA